MYVAHRVVGGVWGNQFPTEAEALQPYGIDKIPII